ncbi:organic cation transporter protein [Leguminivora glycinivorella]|uniref:organic cation transporter protein n=1 Tax=Leguminivora glycinivorella TaxID=1035111 RepID=UPI002010B9E2|nr:organic cation transporter protein [Leguminivora glycinivorella]
MDTVYDRALFEVGDNGLFQKKFDLIYNIVLPFFWMMSYNNLLFVLAIIPHSCELPDKPVNVSELAWKSKYIPTFEDTIGRIKFNECSIYVNPDVNNETTSCAKYTYDKTWYESTVPSDNNWVCDDEIYVANVFSISRFGEIAGALIFGWFGDVYGRRMTYIISLAFIVLGRIVSLLGSSSFLFFVSGALITCISTWTVVQSSYVISMEMSASNRRAVYTTLRSAALSSGMCVLPLLYWWLRDWKLFMSITTSSQLIFLFFSWNIIESPRWSWISGKTDDCIVNLQRIARTNKTTLSPEIENEIRKTPPIGKIQSLGVLALFTHWRLATNTILQLVISLIVTLTYTVLLFTPGEKSDGNPFLEASWQSFAEFPGYFMGALLAERIGRRYTGAVSLSISALMWTIVAFRENNSNGWIQSHWIETSLLFTNRLFITSTYYVINMFNMELYPTCLRQSGMSLGNVISSGGAGIAPYVLYLGRHVDPKWPGLLLAGATLSGAISCLLLPETLNAKLPETLEDAQNFGKKYFPLSKLSSQKQEHNTE